LGFSKREEGEAKGAIRYDSLSIGMSVLAIMIAIYISTWGQSIALLFPIILLLSTVAINYYFGRKVEIDPTLDSNELGDVGLYTVICLVVMAVGGAFAAKVFLPSTLLATLSTTDAAMYGTLIAVAEENLFRGAILSFLAMTTVRPLAIFASASIFVVYHFSVYRANSSALMYVFIAGMVLSYACLRTRRLSPAILAHVINNVAAVMAR